MFRALSIHIGVNRSQCRHGERPLLRHSESGAWSMAELASQAGYDSLLVLRGPAATHGAVHDALVRASQTLGAGDTLLVSFSGHGGQETDRDAEERYGVDQSWCLHDGPLLDDELVGCWRRFEAGVRIVVVSESCYSGGMDRNGDEHAAYAVRTDAPRVMRGSGVMRSGPHGPDPVAAAVAGAVASCIAEPSPDAFGIRASVLMLTASAERQPAKDGLFTRMLLDEWAGATFQGSYCELYGQVSQRVTAQAPLQQPQILMRGAPDPLFPLEPAFHLERVGEPEPMVRSR